VAQAKRDERDTRETGRKPGSRPPRMPDTAREQPNGRAQRSFTDPDSRVMKDGATKSFCRPTLPR